MTIKQFKQGQLGKTASILMTRDTQFSSLTPSHVHIAVCGDVNSGKSTLISVLRTGLLDNGAGLARNQIVRHNHEIETGRTSSISHHALSFDASGDVLNAYKTSSNHSGGGTAGAVRNNSSTSRRLRGLSDVEIAEQTLKIVILADLAGNLSFFLSYFFLFFFSSH